jgi:hypothetical protein
MNIFKQEHEVPAAPAEGRKRPLAAISQAILRAPAGIHQLIILIRLIGNEYRREIARRPPTMLH